MKHEPATKRKTRTVHAIMIQLKSERERSVIIWLKETRNL